MRTFVALLLLLSSSVFAQDASSNSVSFVTSGVWTVPNTVTRLTIEAWGGGGGGSHFGGGQGGGYFRVTIPVPAATNGISRDVHYTVGQGGAGGSDAGQPGTSTSVSYNPTAFVLNAHGGAGNHGPINDNNAGTFDQLTTAQVQAATYSLNGANGQFGSAPKTLAVTAGQKAGTYYISAVGGDGGEAGHATHTRGHGGSEFFLVDLTTSLRNSAYTFLQSPASPGTVPGGGGGGSADVNPPLPSGGTNGANGANGMIIFSWE